MEKIQRGTKVKVIADHAHFNQGDILTVWEHNLLLNNVDATLDGKGYYLISCNSIEII